MQSNFYVKVTVRGQDGQPRSYIDQDRHYSNKHEAIAAGEAAFQNTDNVIQVEVYSDTQGDPIRFFH